MKKSYYNVMYNLTDLIMWQHVDNREHWARWWDISEGFRAKRDAA